MDSKNRWKPWAMSGPGLLVFVTMLLAPLALTAILSLKISR